MTCSFIILTDINFFTTSIPAILLEVFFLVAVFTGMCIYFVKRTKKLNQKLNDLQGEKAALAQLLNNAEDLNRSIAQQNLIERDRADFLISKMNFEIHNCVNGIMGMTGLLKDTVLTTDQKKNTDIIITCSKKLLEAADESFNPDITTNNAKTIGVNNTKQNNVSEPEREKVSKEFHKKYPFKILVAEDDAINQQLARKLLEKLGYTVDIASNGKEALEMVSEKNYDVILMDVLMPEMDGYEATKMIRLCLDTQPIIIALTASAMAGDKEKCIKAGMNDYLCKPININELADLFVKWSEEKNLVS